MFYKLYYTYQKIKRILSLINKIANIEKDFTLEKINKLLNKLENEIFEGGCIYIKFTQWYISNLRSKYLCDDNDELENINMKIFLNHFDKVFNNCPNHDLIFTKNYFKEDFYMNLNDYVEDLEIIASGSIGQVYKGTRINDKKKIVIKVKHPNIEEEIKDFELICKFITNVQKYSLLRKYFGLNINIDEFMNGLKIQNDFDNEVTNNNKFREIYKDNKNIHFPEVYMNSKNIIVSEYIDIICVDTVSEYHKFKGILNYFCFIYDMILITNFIHNDLHSKNWGLMKDGNNYKLVVIDCGLCISSENVNYNRALIESFDNNNSDEVIAAIKNFMPVNKSDEKMIQEYLIDVINKTGVTTKSILNIMNLLVMKRNYILNTFLVNLLISLVLSEEYLKKGNIIHLNEGKSNVGLHLDRIYLDMYTFCEGDNSYKELSNYLKDKINNNKLCKKNEIFCNLTSNIKYLDIE